ncbi:MAG: hypothetical protein DMH00_03970 [Acidobacteria bacterium]|nr:MAG: hypothetical protein DMH00_03970 [Acidobacteriota bacterium]
MDNKRYLLALALSMGVIVVWSYFVLPPPKPPAPAERSPDRGAASAVPPAQPRGDTTPPTFAPEPTDSGASRTAPGKVASGHDTREEAAAEEEKTVETGLFRIHLGNRGARILGWELKRYLDDTGKPLELVSLAAPKLKCFPLDLEFTDPKLTEQVRSGQLPLLRWSGSGSTQSHDTLRFVVPDRPGGGSQS